MSENEMLPQPPPGLPEQIQAGLPSTIFQSGKLILIQRQGFPLPADRCFKCNSPAAITKIKTLYWHHPTVYIALPLNILLYIILSLCLRKTAKVEFGLCQPCDSRRKTKACIWTVITLLVFPLVAYAFSAENVWYALAGFGCFFTGLIGLLISLRIGYPRKIDNAEIHLAGSGPDYRSSFPTFSPHHR